MERFGTLTPLHGINAFERYTSSIEEDALEKVAEDLDLVQLRGALLTLAKTCWKDPIFRPGVWGSPKSLQWPQALTQHQALTMDQTELRLHPPLRAQIANKFSPNPQCEQQRSPGSEASYE